MRLEATAWYQQTRQCSSPIARGQHGVLHGRESCFDPVSPDPIILAGGGAHLAGLRAAPPNRHSDRWARRAESLKPALRRPRQAKRSRWDTRRTCGRLRVCGLPATPGSRLRALAGDSAWHLTSARGRLCNRASESDHSRRRAIDAHRQPGSATTWSARRPKHACAESVRCASRSHCLPCNGWKAVRGTDALRARTGTPNRVWKGAVVNSHLPAMKRITGASTPMVRLIDEPR